MINKELAVGEEGGADWERIRSALLHYKQLYGHLRVPQSFIIPEEDNDCEGWPINTWGTKLGITVSNIRNNGQHKSHRDELLKMGFAFIV